MPKEGKKKWTEKFSGHIVYDKDGVQVIQSKHGDMPFDIIKKDGKTKVLPTGANPATVDFEKLPDIDENNYDANVKNVESYNKPAKPEVSVDAKVMQDFNNYVDWMKQKGYSGNPNMNHVKFSQTVFKEYQKEHPETTLTPDHFLPIQKEIHKYRDNFIEQIKDGKANLNFKPKDDYSDVMEWAGTGLGKKEDAIVGQETSRFQFPSVYMDSKKPENRVGFVPPPEQQGDKFYDKHGQPAPQEPIKPGTGIYYGGKRVAEMYEGDGKSTVKFRNDFGYTGEETEISKEDYNKYFGTATGHIQDEKLFNELKSKATKKETAKE